MESHRFVERGEQLASRRAHSPHLQGGDRKDLANYRPIKCLPTITKIVTLAIYKRTMAWLLRSVETSILECEQRGVRSSQGCKDEVLKNLASTVMKQIIKRLWICIVTSKMVSTT